MGKQPVGVGFNFQGDQMTFENAFILFSVWTILFAVLSLLWLRILLSVAKSVSGRDFRLRHFAPVAFRAYCGADVKNQSTTCQIEGTTCIACLQAIANNFDSYREKSEARDDKYRLRVKNLRASLRKCYEFNLYWSTAMKDDITEGVIGSFIEKSRSLAEMTKLELDADEREEVEAMRTYADNLFKKSVQHTA